MAHLLTVVVDKFDLLCFDTLMTLNLTCIKAILRNNPWFLRRGSLGSLNSSLLLLPLLVNVIIMNGCWKYCELSE